MAKRRACSCPDMCEIDLPRCSRAKARLSMRDHPGTARRKASGGTVADALAAALGVARRFSRAAGATAAMSSCQCGKRSRGRRASFVGRKCETPPGRHRCEVRRGEKSPRRLVAAVRTFTRQIALRHRPRVGERTASAAEIVVDCHRIFPLIAFIVRLRGERGDRHRLCASSKIKPAVSPHLSGDSRTSAPPVMCLVGPSDPGITSNAKISVGR